MEKVRLRRARVTKRNDIANFKINSLIETWLLDIFQLAKNKNVTLIVLLAPESEWFYTNVISREKNLVVDYITAICKREEVMLYDLGKEPFRPDDLDYIEGCNHLGWRGAEKLSRALARYILAPIYNDRGDR